MSTLNVGTANATTVNVGAGGIVFSNSSTLSAAPTPVTSSNLQDLSNVQAASSPSTGQVLSWNGSAWVNSDPSGGVEQGTQGQRPSASAGIVRYNTTRDVLEMYHRNSNGYNRAGWYAVGGRQMLANAQVQESVGSIDIRWGGGASTNSSNYWMYEIAMSFFENPTNDTYWYMRFFDQDNNLSNSGYYYEFFGRYSGDGNYENTYNNDGQIYLNSTSTYRGQTNGEGHHNFMFYLAHTPNNTCNYWSYHWRGGGGFNQENGQGGHYKGGGVWTNGAVNRNIRGFRLYWNGNSYDQPQGVNSVISVYGMGGHEGDELLNSYGQD